MRAAATLASPDSVPIQTLPPSALQFAETIGKGATGVVLSGTCYGERAAIKVFNPDPRPCLDKAMREATMYQVGTIRRW